LFGSGDKLAGAGIWNGNAYLSILSVAH
jgi:hypothetical protein